MVSDPEFTFRIIWKDFFKKNTKLSKVQLKPIKETLLEGEA